MKEGAGKVVERLYRDVRASAIPGGSEEILLDFAMRQARKMLCYCCFHHRHYHRRRHHHHHHCVVTATTTYLY